MASPKIAYPNLAAEVQKAKIGVGKMAMTLGMNRNTLGYQLAGKTDISFELAKRIRDEFFPGANLERLFEKQ